MKLLNFVNHILQRRNNEISIGALQLLFGLTQTIEKRMDD